MFDMTRSLTQPCHVHGGDGGGARREARGRRRVLCDVSVVQSWREIKILIPMLKCFSLHVRLFCIPKYTKCIFGTTVTERQSRQWGSPPY